MIAVPRRVLAAALVALLALTLALPSGAQLPELDDLPIAPDGAVGAILDPLEGLLEQITEPLGDALGDIPLDNAVRLTADDAVDAAIALSRITFDAADTVLIGRDDVFADSLSSVAAQGIAGAPLLLTPTDILDPRTAEELARLGTQDIVILGSTAAISADLEASLQDQFASVSRVGGPTRIETAALLADLIAPTSDRAILMRAYPDAGHDQSQAYADALAAGPLGSVMELPALLTTGDALHPAARDYLTSAGVTHVVIVGGDAAISDAVLVELADLGITSERVAGDNRWGTAIEIARFMGFDDAADTSRLILSEAGAVEEPLWAAGFAAAAQGAVFQAPVVLADGPLLPPETLQFVAAGLLTDALRLGNLPLICNSFVDFLACEAVALLLLGTLDEVDALLGGALSDLLGPVLDQLRALLAEVLPAADGLAPGLIEQILGLLGVPGDDGDPDLAWAAALDAQPDDVAAALEGLVGSADDPASLTRQSALIPVLAALNSALAGPVDTSDPEQAAALASILDAIAEVLGTRATDLPTGQLVDLLVGVEDLLDGLVSDSALGSLGEVVDGLGVDSPLEVTDLVDDVADLLVGSSSFTSAGSLTARYGDEAAELDLTIARLTS